jgi:hypothetical protein
MSLFDRLEEVGAGFGKGAEPVFVSKQSRKQIGWVPMPLGRSPKSGEIIDPVRFEESAATDAQKHAAKRASLVARQLRGLDRTLELGIRALGHAARPPSPDVIPGHLKVAKKYLSDVQAKLNSALSTIDTLSSLRLK